MFGDALRIIWEENKLTKPCPVCGGDYRLIYDEKGKRMCSCFCCDCKGRIPIDKDCSN